MILRNLSLNERILKCVDRLEEKNHPFLTGVVIGMMDCFTAYGAIIWSLGVIASIVRFITKKKEE